MALSRSLRPGALQGMWNGKNQLACGQSRCGKRSLDRDLQRPVFHSTAQT
jgi:hypothetical protein